MSQVVKPDEYSIPSDLGSRVKAAEEAFFRLATGRTETKFLRTIKKNELGEILEIVDRETEMRPDSKLLLTYLQHVKPDEYGSGGSDIADLLSSARKLDSAKVVMGAKNGHDAKSVEDHVSGGAQLFEEAIVVSDLSKTSKFKIKK